MASKNLGAVIQRAIGDGVFRRQLQSDPAAALRGFNLTPTEIAAIRSGDPGKLMSLGVDQRVSKAFTIGTLSGTRAAVTDVTLAGTRGVIHDVPPFGTTGTSAVDDPNSPEYAATQHAADPSGGRVVNDVAPFDSGIANAAAPTSEFIGGDIQHDAGDVTKTFMPSDSADVQREMLDGLHDGGALGNTGGGGNTSS